MKITVLLLLSALGAAATQIAQADSQTLFSDSNTSLQLMRADFALNPSLGRAWLELWVNDSSYAYSDAAVGYYKERVSVAGLSYDPSKSQIVFDSTKGRVVCAKVSTRTHRIRRPSLLITPTGACAIRTQITSEPFDDGIEVQTRQKFTVSLNY